MAVVERGQHGGDPLGDRGVRIDGEMAVPVHVRREEPEVRRATLDAEGFLTVLGGKFGGILSEIHDEAQAFVLVADQLEGLEKLLFLFFDRFHGMYRCTIGMRRPIPKANGVIFSPGAACLRLYSLRSTFPSTSATIPGSKPSAAIPAREYPCST